jgi:hypothetical protein
MKSLKETKYELMHNKSLEAQKMENFLKANNLDFFTTYINKEDNSMLFIEGIEKAYNQHEFKSVRNLITEQIGRLEKIYPN